MKEKSYRSRFVGLISTLMAALYLLAAPVGVLAEGTSEPIFTDRQTAPIVLPTMAKQASIGVGSSTTLRVRSKSKIVKLEWHNSDPKIITVTPNGKVTGIKPGSTDVFCTVYAIGWTFSSLRCKVTVKPPAFEKGSRSLAPGDKTTLVIKYKIPGSRYSYTSSNSAVVAVGRNNGKISCLASGAATITCTVTPPGKTGLKPMTLRCRVRVGNASAAQVQPAAV